MFDRHRTVPRDHCRMLRSASSLSVQPLTFAACTKPHSSQGKWGNLSLDRFQQHLRDNSIDSESVQITIGPKLALKDEVFNGARADEANKMLTREYRAPFVVPKTEDL